MTVVFANAFYFVARLNRRDQHHARVVAFSRDFRARLLTSAWVLMEVADALSDSHCRIRIREFITHLRQSPHCEIIPATRDGLDEAHDLYHKHADRAGPYRLRLIRDHARKEVDRRAHWGSSI